MARLKKRRKAPKTKTVPFDKLMGPKMKRVKIPFSKRPERIPTRKRVHLSDLSKRTISRRLARKELSKIRKFRVLPVYSKISPLNCKKKRAAARRDYFAIKASGAGPRKNLIHKDRLTVRC